MALPLLSKAGADFTKPNNHGVSPLLLLLRHNSEARPLPAAVKTEVLPSWRQGWTRQVRVTVRVCVDIIKLFLCARGAERVSRCMHAGQVCMCACFLST